VRDGVASFFFHPFLDIKYLKSCIDGIEGLGYRFISISDYDLKVQMDNRLIQTYTDTVRLPIQNAYLHRFLMDEKGRRSSESYSQKPQTGIIRDPGIVPPDNILVMEGVLEITAQFHAEPRTPVAVRHPVLQRPGGSAGSHPGTLGQGLLHPALLSERSLLPILGIRLGRGRERKDRYPGRLLQSLRDDDPEQHVFDEFAFDVY
jgi:hypothetical protein